MSSKRPSQTIRDLRYKGRGKIPRYSPIVCYRCNLLTVRTGSKQKYCGTANEKTGCSWIVFKAQKIASRKRNRPKHLEHARKVGREALKRRYKRLKAQGYFQTEEYKEKARAKQKERYWKRKQTPNP